MWRVFDLCRRYSCAIFYFTQVFQHPVWTDLVYYNARGWVVCLCIGFFRALASSTHAPYLCLVVCPSKALSKNRSHYWHKLDFWSASSPSFSQSLLSATASATNWDWTERLASLATWPTHIGHVFVCNRALSGSWGRRCQDRLTFKLWLSPFEFFKSGVAFMLSRFFSLVVIWKDLRFFPSDLLHS